MEILTEVCDHGRPVHGGVWWKGISPCDDCEDLEWQRVKKGTIWGMIVLVALIWVPLCLLLAGVFW